MSNNYIPKQGDLIWLQFNPQVGHEQAGRRPALVLSPEEYNSLTGLAVLCPITSKIKGYPFEVALSADSQIRGVVLSDQIKNLDWKSRDAEFIGEVNQDTLQDVLENIGILLTIR